MKPIQMRESDFKREVEAFSFPDSIKNEFFDYWTEPNKSGTKMRFEMEKTWHLGRRIARWAANGFNSIKNTMATNAKIAQVQKEPANDFERLDNLLSRYLKSPTSIPFEEFGQWYEFMKAEKLLKIFTKGEVFQLQDLYEHDNKKCRCAAVMVSLDGYANTGLRIADLLKMRNQLQCK